MIFSKINSSATQNGFNKKWKVISVILAAYVVFVLIMIVIFLNRVGVQSKQVYISPTPQITSVPRSPLLVKGSIPYWDQKRAFNSFKSNVDVFDQVSLFWYYLTDEGDIEKYKKANADSSIIGFAHKNGVKVSVVITNLPDEEEAGWDSHRVEHILEDGQLMEKHIGDILRLLETLNFDGVSIDYEEVDSVQRDNFTLFVKRLSEKFHPEGKFVSVSLHPKTANEKGYLFQDWEKLAVYADQLHIMAYGEHWDEGEPGPIASVPWIQKIIDYVKQNRIPMDKFYLGIPLYGYDWQIGSDENARGLTFQDVMKLQQKFQLEGEWDSEKKSSFFVYELNGEKHEVWYENSRSISEKVRLAKDGGFAGVSFWRLGGEDNAIWELFSDNDGL